MSYYTLALDVSVPQLAGPGAPSHACMNSGQFINTNLTMEKKIIVYINLLIESALVYGYYHHNSLISLRVHAAHGHAHHVLAAIRTCFPLNLIPK